jgi:hypothetical protein
MTPLAQPRLPSMRARPLIAGALALTAIIAGCTDAPTAPPAADGPHATLDGALPSPLLGASVSQEYSWYEGIAPIAMGSTTSRICVLVFVRGTFDGAGDGVRIYQLGATWYLHGASQQRDVSAKARCYSNVTLGAHEYGAVAPYAGRPSMSTTMLGPPYVCGLTAVRGHFEASGDGVEIYLSGTGVTPVWKLRASVDPFATAPSVSAKARCFSSPSHSDPAVDWQGSQGYSPPPTKLWSTIGDSFCFLSGMLGPFQGTEWLWVYPSGTSWWLAGRSEQGQTRGKARCIRRYGWGPAP